MGFAAAQKTRKRNHINDMPGAGRKFRPLHPDERLLVLRAICQFGKSTPIRQDTSET
jgi:hypothetical protein